MHQGPKYTFQRGRHRNSQQVCEDVFNVTNHKEIKVKSTRRYHFTSLSTAVIKQNKNQKINISKGIKNWKSCTLLVGTQNSAVAIENSMEVPQKTVSRTII